MAETPSREGGRIPPPLRGPPPFGKGGNDRRGPSEPNIKTPSKMEGVFYFSRKSPGCGRRGRLTIRRTQSAAIGSYRLKVCEDFHLLL